MIAAYLVQKKLISSFRAALLLPEGWSGFTKDRNIRVDAVRSPVSRILFLLAFPTDEFLILSNFAFSSVEEPLVVSALRRKREKSVLTRYCKAASRRCDHM